MWLENTWRNNCKILIPNIVSPFLKIVGDLNSFSKNEQEQWKDFLYEIWFNNSDMQTYMQLIWPTEKIAKINYFDVKKFDNNIKIIFKNNFEYIKCVLLDSNELRIFLNNISDKNRVIQLVIEYIQHSFDLLIVNYETKRISFWIFNIVK